MTITIEVPDQVAKKLATLSPLERNRYAVAALVHFTEDDIDLVANDEAEAEQDLTDEVRATHFASIAASIQEHETGQMLDGQDVIAEMRERVSSRRRKP